MPRSALAWNANDSSLLVGEQHLEWLPCAKRLDEGGIKRLCWRKVAEPLTGIEMNPFDRTRIDHGDELPGISAAIEQTLDHVFIRFFRCLPVLRSRRRWRRRLRLGRFAGADRP